MTTMLNSFSSFGFRYEALTLAVNSPIAWLLIAIWIFMNFDVDIEKLVIVLSGIFFSAVAASWYRFVLNVVVKVSVC